MMWLLVAWLLGALSIALANAKFDRVELLSLALWPITVPLFAGLRKWRHWRYTCPGHGYFGDREHYARHLELSHTSTPKGD